MNVHVSREEATQDREGRFVKTRWVQSVKGDEARCRLVAQEFAKAHLLFLRQGFLSAERRVDTRTSCAFLCADINRWVYIEQPTEDLASASGTTVGKLEKALYGARDAPQGWLDKLSKTLTAIGFKMSVRYPGLFFHERLVNLEWARAEL